MTRIAVLGAGAFGTALAITLAREGRTVCLWARDPDHRSALSAERENRRRLPGARFPDTLRVAETVADTAGHVLLLAVPTQQLGAFLEKHRGALDPAAVVLCSKGIDRATGLRPSQLVARHLPNVSVACLTGPSFAEDIARGLPTALTLASRSGGAGLQEDLSGATLRLYLTDDLVGAELGGALKNVIALAAGLTVGAGLGESARAALVTRGFAEMTRFAVSRGARPETLAGLSGLGDLILTCTSEKSRNFSAGCALGDGKALPEGRTIEGLATARILSELARDRGIDMPLADMVAQVTTGALSVHDAAGILMARPLKKE